jgi:hypothetical protein
MARVSLAAFPFGPAIRAWFVPPLASLILIATPAPAEILFWPARLETLPGADPAAVSAVDLNADRVPDLAIALRGSGEVKISLGQGDGTFDLGLAYATGLQHPTALAVIDANRDAVPDLVTVDQVSGDVAVLLGLGNGTLASPVLSPGSLGIAQTIALAVGDLDGDEVFDLAVGGAGIAIMRGLGDGRFAVPELVSTTSWTRAIFLADLNGDRRLDLLAGANGLEVRPGNGNGTFDPPERYLTGNAVFAIGVGQLLDSGAIDVAVTTSEYEKEWGFVQLLEGLGNGALIPRQRLPVGLALEALAVGRIDQDGWLDIAVAGYEDVITHRGDPRDEPPTLESQLTKGALAVLLNRGDGTFSSAVDYEAGPAPQTVAISNLDGDGAADIVVANHTGAVATLLGTGDGSFPSTPKVEPSASPSTIVATDMDRDGATDLVLGSNFPNGLSVRLGNGDGTFDLPTTYPISSPRSVAVADLNGDGRLDVATRHASGQAAVLMGQSDGSLAAPSFYPVVAELNAIAVGDLTGDHIPDIAGVAWRPLPNETGQLAVAPGRGDGSFGPAVGDYADKLGRAAAIGELTGDDFPDLALLFNGGINDTGLLQLHRNLGDGDLGPLGRYSTGLGPQAFALGDLDADSDNDIAVANMRSGDVWVYRNGGDGTFEVLDPFPAGDSPVAIAIGDLSGDLVPDLAVVNHDGANVAVLPGNGDATFGPPTTLYGVQIWASALAIGPLDEKLGLDVVVGGNGLSLLLSRDREPVVVELATFTAATEGTGVKVRWEAAQESAILGYHVCRAERGATGGRLRITPDLVPAGSGRYTIIDADVHPGRYDYWLEELGRTGGVRWYGPRPVDVLPAPATWMAIAAQPEPFAIETVITVSLRGPDAVRLRIYDLNGRLVRTLLDREPMPEGMRRIAWAGTDESGRRLPSGTYVYLAEGNRQTASGKLTIVR